MKHPPSAIAAAIGIAALITLNIFLPLVSQGKQPPIGALHSPIVTNVEPTMQPEPTNAPGETYKAP